MGQICPAASSSATTKDSAIAACRPLREALPVDLNSGVSEPLITLSFQSSPSRPQFLNREEPDQIASFQFHWMILLANFGWDYFIVRIKLMRVVCSF